MDASNISAVPPNDIFAVLEARTTAMDLDECATLLNASVSMLYRNARKGKFPTFPYCDSLLVNPADLARRLRAGSTCSDAPWIAAAPQRRRCLVKYPRPFSLPFRLFFVVEFRHAFVFHCRFGAGAGYLPKCTFLTLQSCQEWRVPRNSGE